jgi:1-aminocyclopropane-1-carboxylate deaminase
MFNINKLEITIDELDDELFIEKNCSVHLLRLDKIHPVISGNKIFKLYYFLKEATRQNLKVITFGGAYSNHLAATAAACREYGLVCVGIVRGEKPSTLSSTLTYCLSQGMTLEFVSREDYKKKDRVFSQQYLQLKYGDHVLIPEGGFSEEGIKGAEVIYSYITNEKYTHICCAIGTATTFAGLIKAAASSQQVIGFSALRKLDIEPRLIYLLKNSSQKNYSLIEDYHFGGYAKKTNELIDFMNAFYDHHAIPLDFVYTAKMMYGVYDLLRKNYFPKGSKIVCVHTGGLQGNCSLQPGVLNF